MLEFSLSQCTNRTIVMRPSKYSELFPFRSITSGYVTADYGFYTKRTERHEYMLIFTVSGQGRMTWHDETVDLVPNSVCLIHCGDYQFYRTISENEPWRHYYIHFDGSCMEAYTELLMDKLRVYFPYDLELFRSSFEIIQKNELRNDPLSLSRINLIITSMLNALVAVRYDVSLPDYNSQDNVLAPAYEYIQKHYQDPITIEELSSACIVSKYYFLHIFKEKTGITPYQYLSRYRIDVAKKLLATADKSISEISHEVGFSNYTNFVAQFKKHVGISPNEYRTSLNKSEYNCPDEKYHHNPIWIK